MCRLSQHSTHISTPLKRLSILPDSLICIAVVHILRRAKHICNLKCKCPQNIRKVLYQQEAIFLTMYVMAQLFCPYCSVRIPSYCAVSKLVKVTTAISIPTQSFLSLTMKCRVQHFTHATRSSKEATSFPPTFNTSQTKHFTHKKFLS